MFLEVAVFVSCFVIYHIAFWLVSPYFCARSSEAYKRVTDEMKARIDCGFASCMNPVIICAFTAAALYLGEMQEQTIGDTWTFTRMVAINGMAYSCYDLQLMLLHRVNSEAGSIIILHHVVAFFAYSLVLNNQHIGPHMVIRNISEIVQPFLAYRFYLYEIGRKESTLYKINGTALMIVYFFSRIFIIPFYWPGFIADTRLSLFDLVAISSFSAVVDAMNIYWFGLILRGFIRVMIRRKGE